MIEEQNINQLPKDWKLEDFNEIANLIRGVSYDKQYAFNNPDKGLIPLMRATNIQKELVLEEFVYVPEKLVKEEQFIKEGDILLAMSSGSKDLVGKAAQAKQNYQIGFGTFCGLIRPKEKIDKKFFGYFFQTKSYRNYVSSISKGIGINNLRRNHIEDLKIPLPPKPTQRAIVSKIEELFSELDKGIEQLKTTQLQSKTYRQSVLKWAFEGKLTNKNVLEGELPGGWKSLKLKDITLDKEGLRRGPFGSAIKKEFFVPDGYKVYEQGNAINNNPYRGKYFVNEEKYNELINFKVKPHDLIVSCSGVTLGRICELPSDAKPGIINQALLRIRLRNDIILNKYFVIHFRAAFFQKKIFDQSQGTAMPNLVGIKDFKEIEMLIPSIEEQNNIVQEIESRLSIADKIEESINQSLQQAEALRQSILKKAFEGRLVANDTIEAIKQTAKTIPFERKVLAGKIIHLLHDDKYFGLTKFQKIFYIVENFAEVPYETNFIQERAGPYDKEFTTAFRKEMQEKDWVQEEQKGMITKFTPGENIGSLISNYTTYFREKGSQIIFILKELKYKPTHEAELIATLYAVWNNRLIKKKPIKTGLLVEDFFNWSPKKKDEFQEEEIRTTYKWMKKIRLIPKGFGKVIELVNE